jgi:uncharacterized membrane protein
MKQPQSGQQAKPGLGQKLALSFVFLWFFIGGIAHFTATDLEMKIVPPWLPGHRLLVQVSGAFELLGALALLSSRTRRVAGLGLVLLTLAVTPANVYMWQRADLFTMIPYWILILRLPFQLALMICIWWSTRRACP